MLRIGRGWRQRDVGTKAKLSAAAIGRHENGILGSPDALERHAAAFSLRLDLTLHGRAGELARLADEEHAAIVEAVAATFRRLRFVMETEASFSEWGERGRIDLLAFDPRSGTLVIVEAKTQLLDLQDLFGALNIKERLGSTLSSLRGWQVRHRASVLAVAVTSANREVVGAHPSLFAGFAVRRLSAFREGTDGRILFWVAAAKAARAAWIAGRQRVRTLRPQLSSREAYPMSATSNEPSEPSPLAR
jgi:transcriptional regulator with XRE-family HTH domain